MMMALNQQNSKLRGRRKKVRRSDASTSQNTDKIFFFHSFHEIKTWRTFRWRWGRRGRGAIFIGWWVKCWCWYRLLVCMAEKNESQVFVNDHGYIHMRGNMFALSEKLFSLSVWENWKSTSSQRTTDDVFSHDMNVLNPGGCVALKCLTNDWLHIYIKSFPSNFWRK